MRKITAAVVIAGALLAGCASPTAAPTAPPSQAAVEPTRTAVPTAPVPTVTPTQPATATSAPTATTTPEPTNTPTAVPTYTLSGTVFFDYNGNGLRDEGEPPIEGAPIRVAGLSTTSGLDGTYSLSGVPAGTQRVYVDSPTQEPATAFRYINRFLGWVDVPAYEISGVSVPAQRVPDTAISPIDRALVTAVSGGQSLDIALMQGFLTLPFRKSQVSEPFIFNYFDIVGIRLFDEDHSFFSTWDGVMQTYDGRYSSWFSPNPYIEGSQVQAGVGDSHTGLDFLIPTGLYIVSGAPTSEVWYLPNEDGELRVHLWFADPEDSTNRFADTYGHLSVQLVTMHQSVCRGQIIGLSGNTGRQSGGFPQVHFDLHRTSPPGGWYYLDPFRYTLELDPLPESFWGSSVSYWTVDNTPQFPGS